MFPINACVASAGDKEIRGTIAVIRSGAEIDYPPFSIVDENGEAGGFSVELMRAAMAAMDREATFRAGQWDEVRGWLERGEIDALPLVGRTPERESLFDFTVPYMSLHGAIVVRNDEVGIRDFTDLRGRRVAVMKGDNAEEFLRREARDFEIRTTPTFEIALRELAEGRHDAVVIQRLVALRLIQKTGLTGLQVVDRPIHGFQQDFCFAVREGDRDTLALLNEGLAIVTADGSHRHLHAKWFAAMQLPADRPIVVGGDRNFPPFEFLDESGRPVGYNVDLTRAIARAMNLNVEIRLGQWPERVEALKNGKIDLLQGMFYSSGRNQYFDFTQAHNVSHYVAVARRGAEPAPEYFDTLRGKRIVTENADIMHDYAIENGLEQWIDLVGDQETALRELAGGRYDCALVLRITALHLIEKHGWSNLVLGKQPLLTAEYCYAVAKGKNALLAQFSEGLKVLENSGEYRRIHDKWLGVYQEKPDSFPTALRYAVLMIIPLLVILMIAFAWSWMLRRQVAEKTRALHESLERFRYVFEAANVGKSITLPTGEVSANQAFADFLGYTLDELKGKRWQNLTPAEDVEIAEKSIAPMMAGSADAVRFEKRYVHKSGRSLWADVSATVRRDADGAPLYFMTTVVDINAKKLAETALRLNEEYQRTMIACSPVALYSIDMDGKVLTWNSSAERIFGWRAAEITGKPLPIIPADKRGEFDALRRQVLEDGGFFGKELMRLKKDGALFPVSLSVAPVRNERGEFVGILGAAEDISERKRGEKALQESEKKFRDLFENAPLGYQSLNADGDFIEINETWCKVLGYTKEEVLGRNFSEFIHPDFREIFKENFPKFRRMGYILGVEFEMIKKDGSEIIVSFDGKIGYKEDGSFKQTHCVLNDITDRKRAQQERERLMMAIGQVGEAIVITDCDAIIQYVNPAFEAITGYAREEAVGRNPRILKSGEQEDAFYGRMWDTLTGGKTWRGRLVNRKKDGGLFTEEAIISPVRDETGRTVNYVAVKRDITEQLKLEMQMRQAQKMESVGRLAGGVAHDYNNMLSVIIGYAEMALDKAASGDSLHEDLTEILKAAMRSADINRQLLAFARRQAIAPKVVDLNETVEGMLKMLRRLIGEDIDLSWLPGSRRMPVFMDPSQLDQILANLCVNARNAIRGVGRLTIETGRVFFDADYCDYHAGFIPGEFIMLSVSDDGCGMEKEILANIFDPFFTTKGLGEGTGLGLATVYGIVKQNDGFINVYSEPGKGTIFKIYLPPYEGADPGIKAKETAEIPAGNGEIVLIVEDEASILKLTQRILEGLGYTVLPAATPVEAANLSEKHAGGIHLLITDVVMPEMNGGELAERLKAHCPGLKVLFMSGYTANVIAHQGVLNKGVNFIQKPFSKQEIAIKVREALRN